MYKNSDNLDKKCLITRPGTTPSAAIVTFFSPALPPSLSILNSVLYFEAIHSNFHISSISGSNPLLPFQFANSLKICKYFLDNPPAGHSKAKTTEMNPPHQFQLISGAPCMG